MLKNASSLSVDAKACHPILGNLGIRYGDGTQVVAFNRMSPHSGRRHQLLGGVSDTHFAAFKWNPPVLRNKDNTCVVTHSEVEAVFRGNNAKSCI